MTLRRARGHTRGPRRRNAGGVATRRVAPSTTRYEYLESIFENHGSSAGRRTRLRRQQRHCPSGRRARGPGVRRLWKERQFHDGFDARVIRLRRLLELPAPRGTSRTRTGSTILDDEPLADSKYIRCRLYPPYPKVAAPPCISHTPRALGAVHTAAKCKQKGWNGKRWRMIRLESSKEGKQEGGNAKHRPVGHDSIISTGRRGRRAAATERAPARTEAHAANQAPDRRFEHDGIKSRAGRARGGGGARPRRAAR